VSRFSEDGKEDSLHLRVALSVITIRIRARIVSRLATPIEKGFSLAQEPSGLGVDFGALLCIARNLDRSEPWTMDCPLRGCRPRLGSPGVARSSSVVAKGAAVRAKVQASGRSGPPIFCPVDIGRRGQTSA